MEVQFGPNSVEEPSLLYKLQRKIKVFNTSDPLPNRGYNLVASSSKYGLVFVAVPDGILTVYQLNQLVDKESEPQHVSVKLQEKPTHISVSCDHELLAVTGGQILSVYKVADFQNTNLAPTFSVKTEVNPSTFVSALQWNPCIPDSIAIAYFDGTLMACMVASGQVKKVPSKARCICWSPKGKQLVTGNSDGTLIQYKPELTAAKLIPAPNLFEGSPVEAIAIYWISTYQFAVVYKNAMDNSRPSVTIINTPKGGQPCCISYEDICYSMGSNRPWYYYLQGLAQWNIIMTSSSNSMEIGTLSSTDGSNWVQWCQSDEARPELPLTDKKVENYPVGLSIDTCAIHQLPWGENETLPFMPLLHVVSQNGLLTTFNVINMKKEAMQLCSPPQLLALPAQALTSAVPGAAAATAPSPAQPAAAPPTKSQAEVSAIQQALQGTQPDPSAVSTSATIKIPSFTPQSNLSFGAPAPAQVKQEPKPAAPSAPAPTPTPAPVATAVPQSDVGQPPQQPQLSAAAKQQQAEENAAKKAEQEKARKAKANQELKDMIVKEVNDFQSELYNFMVKTRETQARLQRDIDTISTNFEDISIDTEELKKECSMEEMRNVIVQLKLELVRACAVVAEARTHSDAKELHLWSQADPLTTKRVASVKKLAYYVQTQLAQAHAALDYKWNEIAARDPQNNKPVKHMIRPILEDVYQPLVRQQEILSRQQAVLRTLKATLEECDLGPVFKSTSLLRTPYRHNKDPLSKLTKNILNMSIESETKPKKPLLSAHKLDALRDVLSNNKTARVKPVNIELRQHLETLRKNYEKSVKEKAGKAQTQAPPTSTMAAKPEKASTVAKPQPVQASVPAFTPLASGKQPPPANVVRILFNEEPKQEIPRPVSKPFEYPTAVATPVATNTKSVLKEVLTNKQANLEAKNNANLFMGQKICSPTAFAQPAAPTPASAPSAVFTSKPIADINNMFNKLQPQPFVPETKSALNLKPDKPSPNIKSSETGEPEGCQAPKPMTNLFAMKAPLASSTPVIGPPKTTQETKAESKITVKPVEKLLTKENVPEKSTENVPKPASKVVEKKEAVKPLASQANKVVSFGAAPSTEGGGTSAPNVPKPLSLKIETKPAPKAAEKSDSAVSTATSIFASANASISPSKTQSAFTTPKSEPETPGSKPSTPVSSASSIFGAAVASQPKTTSSIFSSSTSVFSSTLPTTTVFGAAFGTTAKTTAASIFKSASSISPASETTASVFGSSSVTITPVFGSSAGSVFGKTTSTTTASIFGTPSPTVTTAAAVSSSSSSSSVTSPSTTPSPVVIPTTASASVLPSTTTVTSPTTTAAAIASTTAVASTTTAVFGSALPNTTASVFGSSTVSSPTTASVFGSTTPTVASPTTTASVFGSPTPSVASPATTASMFGTATASVSSSVFGAATTPTGSVFGTAQPSVFGSKEATPSAFTPTTTSIFGATTQASSIFAQASQSVFGATTQASIFGATTQASVFGSPAAQTSIFGSPATTQASVFGSPTQTTQASIFGSPTATTQPSVFGTPTQQTQSVFGSPTQTTQASVFGTPTQATQASIFGSPTQTTQATVFGTPTQATQASIFGTPIQTTQASIFGQAPTTQSGGSLFGGGENLFAAASISTTSASTPGNIFGSPSGSVFGTGGSPNVFGGKSTFGQPNPSAASIFGGSASFGQKPTTNIWGSGGTSSSFGSSGFGQSATTQASSIFGGTGGGSFSQPSGGAFSSPPQQSAFGSPTQHQAPAFGSGAAFGSKPVFGQSPGFGSPTSSGFGSPAAFGGFNKSPGGTAFGAPAFGGGSPFGSPSSPGGGFASATQSNATFENLATQNTLTFGNLAQQTGAAPQPAAPTFNTSPSFTGWRG